VSDERTEMGKMLADMRDHLAGVIEAIDAFLNYLGKPVEASREDVYNKLSWEDREGAKGPFQMTTIKSCGDESLFNHLLAVLRQNKRRHSEKSWGHYYWLGSDDNMIFRRKKKSAGD